MNKFLLTTTFLSLFFLSNLTLNAQENKQESLPPLHQAVLDNDIEKAKILIQNGSSVLQKTDMNATPMMLAVYGGNLEMVKLIHQSYLEEISKPQLVRGLTLFSCTYPLDTGRYRDRYTFKEFPNYTTNFKLPDDISTYKFPDDIDPLHLAVYQGNMEIIDYLLNNGYIADNSNIKNGITPFHIAIEKGRADIMRRLLKEKIDINYHNCNRTHPFPLAISVDCKECVQVLLENNASIDKIGIHEFYPFTMAVALKKYDMIPLFLEHNADVNAHTINSYQPLIYAIMNKDDKMVSLLLNNKADPNISFVKYPNLDGFYIFLPHFSLLNKITPLGLSILKNDETIFNQLLNAGADIHILNESKFQAIHLASHTGNTNILKKLIEKGADINAKDIRENTPLHFAKNKETALLLLQNGANLTQENNNGLMPVYMINDKEAILFLLEKLKEKNIPFDVNKKDRKNHSLLHIAAHYNNPELAELWIQKGIDINQSNSDTPPLHYAAKIKESSPEFIKVLLQNKADVNQKTKLGETALHYANSPEIAQLLIDNNADVNAKDSAGNTPLHLIDNIDTIKVLIQNGADIKAKNNNGETPIQHTLNKNYSYKLEKVQTLIENGDNFNIKDKDGRSLLHLAVQEKKGDLLHLLLQKGMDVNIQDNYGYTPLAFVATSSVEYSSKTPNKELIEILLNNKADVNIKDKNGNTILHLVAQHRFLDDVKFFISKGANVYAQNNQGETCFHILAKKYSIHSTDVATFLSNYDIKNIKDKFGKTALDYFNDDKNHYGYDLPNDPKIEHYSNWK